MKYILHNVPDQLPILALRAAKIANDKGLAVGEVTFPSFENGDVFRCKRNKDSIAVWLEWSM